MKGLIIFSLIFLLGISIFLRVTNTHLILKPNLQEETPTQEKNILPIRTIEDVFKETSVNLDPNETVTLIVTGDIIPARSVNYLASTKNSFDWPYKEVRNLTNKGDLTLINLEAPLIKDCPLTKEGFVFCGNQKHIEGFKLLGVDVVNLANNHSGNYGKEGIEETVKVLEENDIKVTGLTERNILYREIKGTKFAFLGYDIIGPRVEEISWADKEVTKKEITEAKRNADLVIVSMSWGTEYTTNITNQQKELAYLAIDSGADLIVGNHPHWIQPLEIYRGKLIMYAHGNFIFDQEWSEKTKEGVVGEYTFFKGSLVNVKFTPIYIINYGQATIADEDRSKRILKELKEESLKLERGDN